MCAAAAHDTLDRQCLRCATWVLCWSNHSTGQLHTHNLLCNCKGYARTTSVLLQLLTIIAGFYLILCWRGVSSRSPLRLYLILLPALPASLPCLPTCSLTCWILWLVKRRLLAQTGIFAISSRRFLIGRICRTWLCGGEARISSARRHFFCYRGVKFVNQLSTCGNSRGIYASYSIGSQFLNFTLCSSSWQ